MTRLLRRVAFIGILGLFGCADSRQTLDVKRDFSSDSFTASFDRAYWSRAIDGQTDLILLAGGAEGSGSPIDQPLGANDRRPVNQIVHIHVLWQEPRTLRPDNPASTNAKVEWHIMASPEDRVVYTGACWARLKFDDDVANIELRNAGVSITRIVGNMADPLKRARLDGTIEATRSDTIVRSYLDEIATLEHSTSTALSGPPFRNAISP